MFKVRVLVPFNDKRHNEEYRAPGTIFTVEDEARLRELLGNNSKRTRFVELLQVNKKNKSKTTGPKVVIFQDYLYFIGGIETFLFNLTKNYQDRNITIRCKKIELEQAIVLSQYCNVVIDDGTEFSCDVLILGNYNCDYVLSRVKTKAVYQMIHADWRGILKMPGWKDFNWKKHSDIKKIISVSEAAAQGLKETMNYDSEVIYNILDKDYEQEEGLTFITLSRATAEKGIDRMIKMAKEFKKHNKKFIWFICCSLNQVRDRKTLDAIRSIPEFVIVPPSDKNKMLIKNCDYLVQLSDTESFCYSAYEALQRNVPVILTDFPEAHNIVDDGENGFIVNMDLSNLDVDRIFNHKPQATYYIDRCNHEMWEKVFRGEL